MLVLLAMSLCALPLGLFALVTALTQKENHTLPITLNVLVIFVAVLMGAIAIGNALYGQHQVSRAIEFADPEVRDELQRVGDEEVQRSALVGMAICLGPLSFGIFGLGVVLANRRRQRTSQIGS